jgi:hypothetical protein
MKSMMLKITLHNGAFSFEYASLQRKYLHDSNFEH